MQLARKFLKYTGARGKVPLAFTKVVSPFQALTMDPKIGCLPQVSIKLNESQNNGNNADVCDGE